jgi:DNA ligase (NAD+)
MEAYGVGSAAAKSIHSWCQENRLLIEDLHYMGLGIKYTAESSEEKKKSNAFSGLQFVVTGTIEGQTRESVHAFIQLHGGTVGGAVSGKTNFLVAGEKAGSKLTKARSLNVTVISFDKLVAMSKEDKND